MAVALHQLAQLAADSRPDSEAFRCGEESLTWSELLRRSHGLAHALRGTGLRRGDRVGVLLKKSLRVPLSFYGVFAAGGALVPIDPKSPPQHVQRILRETGATHLITEMGRDELVADLLETSPALQHVVGADVPSPPFVNALPWSKVEALATDLPPDAPVGGLDTAYILHTSGSTGIPKLIRHTHASAMAFVDWAAREYGIGPEDRLSNHSSHHTCFATFDFYAAAYGRATTVLLTPAAMMMPMSLSALLEQEQVSVWYSVPTALVQLLLRGGLEERSLDALRWVLFAGETFPHKHLQRLVRYLPKARFSHVYGSTEANVCTYYHLPQTGDVPDPLPIGRPCSNARALVVDEALEPVKPGEPGELLIQGSTLMSGYWGDSERNSQALVALPAPGGFDDIYFRTGDRVRQDDDGDLNFAGRTDLQVKVRGHRVELEEVEHALLAITGIQEAVAFALDDTEGSAYIRAAVVCDPQAKLDTSRVRGEVSGALPSYAIPTEIDLLPSLPRTATGKIDRKAIASAHRLERTPHD